MAKKDKKYYCIKRGISRPLVLEVELKVVGETKEDFFNKKLIPISQKQAKFYEENPTASFDEIMSIKMNPVIAIPEVPIEEQYQQRISEEISRKYTLDEEIRILYNGESDPRWQEHEDFVAEVKKQVKKELGI